jgi:hypothetical protein
MQRTTARPAGTPITALAFLSNKPLTLVMSLATFAASESGRAVMTSGHKPG